MTGNLFENTADGGAAAATGWFTAHCDGGSRGNPGPAGYGAVIEDAQGQVVARLSEFLGHQTNNYADSELMVRQMKGIYKVKSPGLVPLWQEARGMTRRLDAFDMRHTLRGGNKEADRLANEAMDKGQRVSKSAS